MWGSGWVLPLAVDYAREIGLGLCPPPVPLGPVFSTHIHTYTPRFKIQDYFLLSDALLHRVPASPEAHVLGGQQE